MRLLFDYFHQETKDKTEGGLVRIPFDRSLWPESWKTVYYKSIERAPFIAFPPHTKTDKGFYDILTHRTSPSVFEGRPLTQEHLGTILQLSYGEWEEKNGGQRTAPSGGARYPLELYVLAWNVEGLTPGVYHYNIKKHGLEHYVWQEFSKESLPHYVSYDWVASGSALIIVTSVFARSTAKYGSRGYRYILLEGGHVGQNIYLTAESVGRSARALGGINDQALESLLDIDGTTESIIYALGIG